jgi:hypothetical protein
MRRAPSCHPSTAALPCPSVRAGASRHRGDAVTGSGSAQPLPREEGRDSMRSARSLVACGMAVFRQERGLSAVKKSVGKTGSL